MLRSILALLAIALSGCLQSRAVSCADGTICAEGTSCDPEHRQCLRPEQQVACADLSEGAVCPIDTEIGVCRDGLCLHVVCGDGLIQLTEQCDGAAPALRCFDVGFDAGTTRCDQQTCAADMSSCRPLGWKPMYAVGAEVVRQISGVPGLGLAARGFLLELRGTSWEAAPLVAANVQSVYAASATSGFALTLAGLYRFDGAAWTLDRVAGTDIRAGVVFGSGTEDVFVLALAPGLSTAIELVGYHLDARGWHPLTMPSTLDAPLSGWSGPPGAWYATKSQLYRLTGTAWSPVATPLAVVGDVTGFGASVFVAGMTAAGRTSPSKPVVLRLAGAGWDSVDVSAELRVTGPQARLGLGGRAANDFYVFAPGTSNLVHFDGQYWQRADAPKGLLTIAAVGDVLFAGTDDGVARESPDWLVDLSEPSSMGRELDRTLVTAASCTDVTAAVARAPSQTRLLRFDGQSWTEAPRLAYEVTAITTAPDGTSYAVAANGNVLRRGTAGWGVVTQLPTRLQAIAAGAGGHLAVVGAGGRIDRYDGSWHTDQIPGGDLSGIAMTADDDIVAVGRSGVVAYDGRAWSPVAAPLAPGLALRAVWAAANGTVIAVGQNGSAFHRGRDGWHADPSLPRADYVAVHGASATDVFAIAAEGSLAHFDGAVWSPVRATLRGGTGVWASPACTYLGGTGMSGPMMGAATLYRLARRTAW